MHNYYKITELADKNVRIVIKCFYDNSIIFSGAYNDIPKHWLETTYRIFTPKFKGDTLTHYEFII